MMNRKILLRSRPQDWPTEETFEFKEEPVPQPGEGQVLVRSIYLSVDPYMRGRMSAAKSYTEPYRIGEVIEGGVVGEVVESRSDKLKPGDKVLGLLGWQLYGVADADKLRKLDEQAAPLSAYLGVIGMTGLTAYFGLMDIGKPKAGETVVVSGAAGAVGSIVGQIAKIQGARVVGIAGSDDKTAWLTEELGFDAAINYKTTTNMQEALARACPQGVDVYFDNVGGEISDAVISQINDYARIALCGAISAYNYSSDEADVGPRVFIKLIKTRSLMKGFVLAEYMDRLPEGARKLGEWLSAGKLKYEETIIEGFDRVPEAFLELFKGSNIGKMLVKVG
ncbi:NADP-dependent oxidoreductase [Cohnella ginsengisoli]|uniref:NADP-dependent oxidoreductase n=1 Tax=Cohnella ginsengisoli TaxID=425004 RepID=A0A9X4KNB6_9BACL|nr:NADP-dependent oxidoreductase [Cohnella ginsengisoli]MDG0795130.1 NADP-dependent oxidoreductase [Cohnella ginsengisoli]